MSVTVENNPILKTDSYKFSHYLQYPPNTSKVYSYIEARQPLFNNEALYGNKSVFFGLQMFLMEYLSKPWTKEMVEHAEARVRAHGLPFNRAGFDHIINKHGGYLPLLIKAVPEGTVMDIHNVQVTVENTDPNSQWLTSFMETTLLRSVWNPSTICTASRELKKIIYKFLVETCDNPDAEIPFKLHDFGARGVSSGESAGLAGVAHLVNFMGTDTFEAIEYAKRFYDEDMAGFSIPAAEHSTITSWGSHPENEEEAYDNMLNQFAQEGKLVAVVSDSFDLWNAVSNIWGDSLKEKVEKSGATVVVRPDSGDPNTVPVECVRLLMEKYGYTENEKGYKVLPKCIRVIQGDGISLKSGAITNILNGLKELRISAENIAFGAGGGLLQHFNRDDLGYAMKCSAIEVDGVWRPVVKKPKTDSKKISKAGRLQLTSELGKDNEYHYTTIQEGSTWIDRDMLETVYRNGEILRHQTLKDVRERAAI